MVFGACVVATGAVVDVLAFGTGVGAVVVGAVDVALVGPGAEAAAGVAALALPEPLRGTQLAVTF